MNWALFLHATNWDLIPGFSYSPLELLEVILELQGMEKPGAQLGVSKTKPKTIKKCISVVSL